MIELRWIYKKGMPKQGWIPIGSGAQLLYQVLQYRHLYSRIDASGALNVLPGPEWSEWRDVEMALPEPEDV